MAADTMDNNSHPIENAASPPVDYYGATVWVDRAGVYWMAAVRDFHWNNGPFAWEGKGWKPGGQPLGSYDIALAMSADGSHFELLGERRPWMQPSRDGTAGSRRLWLASPGPIASGNQTDADLLYFFTRSNTAELGTGAIDPALATPEWLSEIVVGSIRQDGLCAIEAPYGQSDVLTTKALTFPEGTELILNLDTGGGSGSLVVVVKAAVNGSTLATSTPVSANAVSLPARGWMPGSRSIASLAGTVVTIEFHMESMLFYSFRFSDTTIAQQRPQRPLKTDDDVSHFTQAGTEAGGVFRMPMMHHSKLAALPLLLLVVARSTAGAASAAADREAVEGPCDLLAEAGNQCVAAHSTVRSLYAHYAGPLYRVSRPNNASANISVLEPGGFADIAAHEKFCAAGDCVIANVFDQSPQG